MKDIIIIILKDYLQQTKKINLDIEIIAEDIIKEQLQSYDEYQNKINTIFQFYKSNKNLNLQIQSSIFIEKLMKNLWNITKKKYYSNYDYNGYLHEFIFTYLNLKYNTFYNFSTIMKIEKNLFIKSKLLNIDYNLLFKLNNKTYVEVAKELEISGERVRQREKKIIEFINNENINFEYDYISKEELPLIPLEQQLFLLANQQELYDSYYNLYIYNKNIKEQLEFLKLAIDELINNGKRYIDKLYYRNINFVNIIINNDNRIYMSNNRVYSKIRNNDAHLSNYILNYCDEYNIYNLTLNNDFLKNFSKSIHGELYFKKSLKKVTITHLISNIERDKKLVKIDTKQYINPSILDKKINSNKDIIIKKINDNLPIEKTSILVDLFKESSNKLGLKENSIYHILKHYFHNEYRFFKKKIYFKNDVPVMLKDQALEALKSTGIYKLTLVTNLSYILNYIEDHLDSDKIFYRTGVIYYLDEKCFTDYKYFKQLEVPYTFKSLTSKKDVINLMTDSDKKKYDAETFFKIWCKINNLYDLDICASNTNKISDLYSLLNMLIDDITNISKEKIFNLFSLFLLPKEIDKIIASLLKNDILSYNDNGFYSLNEKKD